MHQNFNDASKEALKPVYYLGSLIIGLVLPTFFTNIKLDSLNFKLNYNTALICFIASTIGCLLNFIVHYILLSFSVKYLNWEIISMLYGLFNGLLFTFIIDDKIIKFDFSFYEKLLALLIYYISTCIGTAFKFSTVNMPLN